MPTQQSESIPVHSAESLTKGGAMAHIQLNGMTYYLRITRAGKLILTKLAGPVGMVKSG